MNKSISYWEREEWLQPADLIVVGGGIVGTSVALFYKEKHPEKDVIILERGVTPLGASTRNAGFSCIGSISEHLADIKLTSLETVKTRIHRRWSGLQLLKSTMGEEALEYQSTGGYELFFDEDLYDRSIGEIEFLNASLLDLLGEENVYEETDYEGVPAVFNRLDGAINSGKLMRILHQRVAGLGVRTLWNSEVDAFQSNRVELKNGMELQAEKIVLAVNGFVSKLCDLDVKPARGLVFITQPIPGLKWRGTFNFNEGYVYFRNVGDRLLLGGGRNVAKEEETTDQFGSNPKIREYLIRFANEQLKLPERWEIELEWSGIMGMTADKEPVITEVEPNVWAAAGLSGMGIAIGMQVAKEVVERL